MADIQNGRHLKAIRVYADLTQKELAEKTGISLNTIARMEHRDLLYLNWSSNISFKIHKFFDDLGIDILENCGVNKRGTDTYVGMVAVEDKFNTLHTAPKRLDLSPNPLNIDNYKLEERYSVERVLQDWAVAIAEMKELKDIYTGEFEFDIEREKGNVERVKCYLENIQTTGTSLADEGVTCDFTVTFKFKPT